MSLRDLQRQQEESKRRVYVTQQLESFRTNVVPLILKLVAEELAQKGFVTRRYGPGNCHIDGTSSPTVRVFPPDYFSLRDNMVDWDIGYSSKGATHTSPIEPLNFPILLVTEGGTHLEGIYVWKGYEDNERVSKAIIAVLTGNTVDGDFGHLFGKQRPDQQSTGCLVPIVIFVLLTIGACTLLR